MVRIPKTGSTSIVKGLFGGIEQASGISLGVFPDAWRPLYAFAFVRNPYDRLASALRMFASYPVATEEERRFRDALALDRVLDLLDDPSVSPAGDGYLNKLKLHCLPMTSSFFHLDKVADIYRFEDFERGYAALARTLGLAPQAVPHVRKSGGQHDVAWVRDHRRRVDDVFGGDLSAFGYTFRSDSNSL